MEPAKSADPKRRIVSLKDAPEELRRLPEPLRTKALEAANELLAEDPEVGRAEALRRGIDVAREFHATRMPHAKTPEEADDEHLPTPQREDT